MGFKKATHKKKKQKKKSSSDREWDFEGGQHYEQTVTDQTAPRGPRQTQERDERLRRGRNKIEMKKEKREFVKKMSQKVSFNQILGLEENDIQTDSIPAKRPRIESNPQKSSAQIYNKIQHFFVGSTHKLDSGSENEEEFEEQAENTDSENELEYITPEEEVKTQAGLRLMDSGEVSDLENRSWSFGYADWFFSTKEEDDMSQPPSAIQKIEIQLSSDLTSVISGKIHPLLSPVSIETLGDIPFLHQMWSHVYHNSFISQIEPNLLAYLSCYADLFFEGRDEWTDSNILNAALWHILGHLVNSRVTVMKHDKYLKKINAIKKIVDQTHSNGNAKKKSKKPIDLEIEQPLDQLDEDNVPVDGGMDLNIDDLSSENINLQDSGYTRPRVLILCPFRSSAYNIVSTMRDIFKVNNDSEVREKTTIKNWDKFQTEFGPGDIENDKFVDQHKPSDWKSIFKDNVDDDFKIGIQINPLSGKGNGNSKGVHMRLFSDFYHSDVIVASPLGLRMILENSTKGETGSKIENEYLSSLEIIYLHQTDVLFMQNWNHVEFVIRNCNNLPKNDQGVDFTRVRPYFLENLSKSHRQIILSSQFQDPHFNSFLREECLSRAGLIKFKKNYHEGSLNQITIQTKQIFNIIPTTSLIQEDQERFIYFRDTILIPLLRLKQYHTLIVAPSYLNYVQIRNELLRREANAAFICEYSRESEISRGRSQFFHGVKEILLYSGRAHFFRRFRIRGARHLIFYSLPEFAHFYPEIINLLGTTETHDENKLTSCIVLCTKYEKMALERIVGVKRCEHMLRSGKTTFMFY